MTAGTPQRVEHPFDRQRRAFAGIIGLVLLAALFAVGGALPAEQARATASDGYLASTAAYATARARYVDAKAQLLAAGASVAQVADLLTPILALSGDPIPPEATAALDAAREAALEAVDAGDAADPPPTPTTDPAALSLNELHADAAEWAAKADSLDAAATSLAARADGATSAATALGTALADFTTAVTQRGVELLAGDHPADAPIDAYRSALDALPEVPTDSLPASLQALIGLAGQLH